MQIKNIMLVALVSTASFFACKQSPKFTKIPDAGGREYAVISDGKGTPLKYDEFFEVLPRNVYSYKDSVLTPEDEVVGQLGRLDSVQMAPAFFKIFSKLRVGDSVVIRVKTDSILAQNPNLPWMKKGYYMYETYKIVGAYNPKDSVKLIAVQQRNAEKGKIAQEKAYARMQKADSTERAKQIVEDDKIIKSYLAKNNVTNTVKAPAGTYVEILKPGTGEKITDSFAVTVKYVGKNFAGKIFDRNTDSATNAVIKGRELTAYLFYPGQLIKGWEDGLKLLSKGAVARFYVPSALAYGKEGRGPESGIGPNENLVFDIEVTDVEHRKTAQAKFNKMMEANQRMQQQRQAQQQQMEAAARQMQQQQQQGGGAPRQ
jgi:FKBP-type peptidyl-prolyl cis-trans isomerase FkpA